MHAADDFLRAIEAEPGDRTRRLVFADWLDERADPRGELIRVEEEMRTLPAFSDRFWELKPRRNELRASKIMQERALSNPKIQILWDSEVASIEGDTKLTGITVRSTTTGEIADLPVTGLFVAIGHRPNTDLFKGVLDMEDNGYLITGPGTATNIDGVFACGDVQDHTYRQAITAAGSGCMAAIDAERWLEANVHG